MHPLFRESLSPISPRLLSLSEWVRENTSRDSVFLVSKNLGPWLPAFTGRRVVVMDDTRSEPPPSGVTHVVVLRADDDRLKRLVSEAQWKKIHSVARWARVYAIVVPRERG